MPHREDPAPAFRFRVEIDGVLLAAFQSCVGLATETEVFEFREGGMRQGTHKMIGYTRHPPIRLWRGITLSEDLFRWREEAILGTADSRRTGDILLSSDSGETIRRWTFLDGWPSRWEGPVLLGERSAIAIEMIEIVHEGLVMGR